VKGGGPNNMKKLKKLTILHSNDLHGDFTAEQVDEKLVGGVSRLSGYVNKVRNEEKNVIYAVAGDMFRGSVIDSEFQGISTIEIMNLLAPDVVTLGNHEVDYGLAHLLFLEKCATFPIINANMHLKKNGVRLFRSHYVKEIDGMRVLFIGILTEDVLDATKVQGLVGTLVDIEDAANEVGKICDAYRNVDIDFTVLLTHIGFEKDKMLAEKLDPDWGVDLIIGGHSHTKLSEPCVVAGIPIVQAAVGTDQIGRFDIMVDTDNNCIDSYTWQCIPITADNCPSDPDLEKLITEYVDYTNAKYERVITRFLRKYTHLNQRTETELGDLVADCFREQLDVDLIMLGSASIRLKELGPIVTLGDFRTLFPFGGPLYRVTMTGEQIRHALQFMLRDAAFDRTIRTEWFQFSKGFYCEYDKQTRCIVSLKMNGKEVSDSDLFSVVLQNYHYLNMKSTLDLSPGEVEKNKKAIKIASDAQNVLEEYFVAHPLIELEGTPRVVIHMD
jgi:5'-nucleotidase